MTRPLTIQEAAERIGISDTAVVAKHELRPKTEGYAMLQKYGYQP